MTTDLHDTQIRFFILSTASRPFALQNFTKHTCMRNMRCLHCHRACDDTQTSPMIMKGIEHEQATQYRPE